MTEPLAPPAFEEYVLKPPAVEMVQFKGNPDVERFVAWLTANLPEGAYINGGYNAIWFGTPEDQRYLFDTGYLCRNAAGDIFVHNPDAVRALYDKVPAPAPE